MLKRGDRSRGVQIGNELNSNRNNHNLVVKICLDQAEHTPYDFPGDKPDL